MEKTEPRIATDTSDAIRKVQWFLENLELQLEERRLRGEGRSTLVIFDTSSVRAALLGMDYFLTARQNFDVRSFNKKYVLVHALASAGWLGAIQMLLPHQNEFLTQVNLDFGSEARGSGLRDSAHRFWQALKIKQEILDSKNLRSLSYEARIKLVRDSVGSAEKLFKAIQLIRGSWRTKLVDWLDTKQLVISDVSDDDWNFEEVMSDVPFQRLRKAFHFFRSDKDLNNSVDALALADLVRKLRIFSSDGYKALPVLFSPNGFFEKVVRKSGLQPRFFYTSEQGRRFNAIRSSDFFIFKAIFNPPREFAERFERENVFSISTGELTELRDRVALILEARATLEEALDKTTGLGDKPLGRLIDDIRYLTFFENVWLPSSPKDLEQAEQELQEASESLRSEAFRDAADEALNRAKQEIEKKTRTYRELTELWSRLVRATKELHRRLDDTQKEQRQSASGSGLTEVRELDPFLHFGLLRFSLPRGAYEFIRNTVSALVSRDGTAERDAQLGVVQKFRRARHEEVHSEVLLAELAGVLWSLELSEDLINLLEGARPLSSFSLDLVLAATYFRIGRKVGEGSLLLRDLTEKYVNLPPNKLGQLMIGLAYLHFHLLLCLDLLREPPSDEVVSEHFTNAIFYARRARELLQEIPSRVYALNCHLYYMVEFGDPRYREDMRSTAEELKKWIDKPGIWQFRFDDTLARYYFFVSRLAADKAASSLAMKQSLEFIGRAWRAALGDHEVLTFQGTLVDGWSR